MAVMPEPPYSSGSCSPIRSRWASCFQRSAEYPIGSSWSSRTALRGLVVAHTPRTVWRSISCSALNLRSNMVSTPLVVG